MCPIDVVRSGSCVWTGCRGLGSGCLQPMTIYLVAAHTELDCLERCLV